MPPPEGRSAIETEAGQRAGAVNGTRLRSQRPAEPTVTDFSGVLDISDLRCRVCPLSCVDGAVSWQNQRNTGISYGAAQTRPSCFAQVPYPANGIRRVADGIENFLFSLDIAGTLW